MTRGVCWYLVGSFVLVSLAGCGHGFFSEEREPWRAEAEVACLKSGSVKEGPDLVRISPISGPGACGADFPLRVAALGESNGSFGFADEDLRPPAAIGNQPRWPANQPPPSPPPPSSHYSSQPYPSQPYRAPGYGGANNGSPDYGAPSNGPVSLRAPGVPPPEEDDIALPREGARGWQAGPSSPLAPQAAYPRDRYAPMPPGRAEAPGSVPAPNDQPPRLGPGPMQPFVVAGPVAVKPAATLACPIVSVLDHWLTENVQPAAQRWFGQRVVEIKQISAYSCRGMNGNPNAHISEHAFGNALDIAAFTLADGRHVSVKDGWRGLPEEQGFLRDSRRLICQPAAISGEEVAARAMQRNPYASHEQSVTGSLGVRKTASVHKHGERVNEEDEFEDE
jgi:hypothetical protein